MLPQTLLSILLTTVLSTTTIAMSLAPRDTIHASDMDRYNAVMSTVKGSQFLHLYLKDNQVKLDIYEDPSNALVSQNSFAPSENAPKYFEQEEKREEALQNEEAEAVNKDNSAANKDTGNGQAA
ncbi:conserved hypothetical protein [Talaromyces stipitatus ATCC 10500]|uniref:Uncharacterized protein n=1 Tax=Talaromyces stipitatus (strain ATCC 10500 / CBS 375.48 / QM 6759 / NRRL 1006) TaxID=441959 RepID=B8M3K3_TALSN|nr:uncharacterized protein TSTA_096240 [Talaromyces stipitatus ATCC 10500]EED22375.1 conserved hypothetical protein [Talaromyces stipitatus ATCC 10500]